MSKVYFTDFNTKPGLNILDKLSKLLKHAGLGQMSLDKKFAALKIHLGEPGNLGCLRPIYAAAIAREVAALGGIPFLTDACTLYVGRRSNAVDHLQAAAENGFTAMTCGCPVLIADGLKGTGQRVVPVDGKHCKQAYIGELIADADVIVSVTHFKGHGDCGFGGALKNIGMGSGSRAGKLDMHSTAKPRFITKRCVGCGLCIRNCAFAAITRDADKKAVMDDAKCSGCGQCIAMCQYEAVQPVWDCSGEVLGEKIAEYTKAVLDGKQHFHISFLNNISPNCDCFGHNEVPIVPDIGILASFDPVAIDRAAVDLVNSAPMLPGSLLAEKAYEQGDKFTHIHPQTDWRACLAHGESLGLGENAYELIKL